MADDNDFGLTAPASGLLAVTPSDDTILTGVRALYIGGAGFLAVTMFDGSTGTLAVAGAGDILPLRVRKVMATGTTATGIVALV